MQKSKLNQKLMRELKSFDEDKSVANAKLKALDACKLCGIAILDDTSHFALTTLEETTTKIWVNLKCQNQGWRNTSN